MDLHTFLNDLPAERRDLFASACGTTFLRLRQIGYGNEPASPQLCVAIDRESRGVIAYDRVNDRWTQRKGASDTRRRIPMDWDYIERKAQGSDRVK